MPDPQKGSSSEGGTSGGTPSGDNDPKAPDPKGDGPDKGSGENVITRETLQGAQNALKRTLLDQIKNSSSSLKGELATMIAEEMAKLKPTDHDSGGDKKKGKDKLDPEVARILREHKDLQAQFDTTQKELQTQIDKNRREHFKSRVVKELQKAGYKRPEVAFRILSEDLTTDENDPDRIFHTMKDSYGNEHDVGLEEYITHTARNEIIPELFPANSGGGAPAGGDSGSGKGYLFTESQINNPEFYMKHKDEIRAALEAGRVKGVPPPGQAGRITS